MKKTVKVVVWTALTFIGLGLVLFFIGVIAAKGDFSKMATVQYERRERTVEDAFADISVEQYAGNVYILPTAEGVCRVEYMESENILQDISVVDGVLKIAERDNRKWYECIGIFWGVEKEMRIYLPQREYQSLCVKAASGDITLSQGLTFSSVDVHVESGEITLSTVSKSQISLTSQSGDIQVKGATTATLIVSAQSGTIEIENVTASENISLETQSGEIEVDEVNGRGFSAKAQSGDVELTNVLTTGITEIETASGNVELNWCDAAGYRITASSGNVEGVLRTPKVFYANASSGNVDVPQSNEGGMVEVKTHSGNIRFHIGE